MVGRGLTLDRRYPFSYTGRFARPGAIRAGMGERRFGLRYLMTPISFQNLAAPGCHGMDMPAAMPSVVRLFACA